MDCFTDIRRVWFFFVRESRLTRQHRDDRPLLHIPKSFDQLKALNGLLKKYRDIYPYRIVVCYVTTYLL